MHCVIASINLLNSYASIEERLPRLADHLAAERPTIFAGQEVLIEPGTRDGVFLSIREAMDAAGLSLAVAGATSSEGRSGNAIWYRQDQLRLVSVGALDALPEHALNKQPAETVFAVFEPVDGSATLVLFSVHLAWGAEHGAVRLRSVRAIEAKAAELTETHPGAVIIVTGDFNARPRTAAMQYLRGETAIEPGTFWIDAWEWLNPGEAGVTQIPSSKYAAQTALSSGIRDSSLIPDQRIDYLMIRGWSYARLGSAPRMTLWGAAGFGELSGDVSDHLGLQLAFDL